MNHRLSPSILNSDFLELKKNIRMLNESEADWIHLDIMDGVFVPNLTFGFPIIKQIKSVAEKPLDVHLMIVHPEKYLERYKEVGADILTVHYEACDDLSATLSEIKSLGMKASVSVKPATPVEVLEPFLHQLEMVLIMTVEPGYGGQAFIEASYERIRQLKALIQKAGSQTLIEVDGGVGPDNLKQLKEAGVDVFVVGTTIFKNEDPPKMIRLLKGM
ncbi:ribulose-phosphate 3-epimerase [Bacteroidota bacterium]